jgi:cbb3-type cytochrome oxidase subunit 3
MFKQFTQNAKVPQPYLIFSLAIFLVFFIVVGILLLRMKKKDVDHMKELPLTDDDNKPV